LHEADLLTIGVEQRECALRVQDCQRQAGKARAGPDIGDAAAGQQRGDRQAVEQMVREPFVTAVQCRQVIGLVPLAEFIQQPLHLARLRGSQRHAQPRRAANKALTFIRVGCDLIHALVKA